METITAAQYTAKNVRSSTRATRRHSASTCSRASRSSRRAEYDRKRRVISCTSSTNCVLNVVEQSGSTDFSSEAFAATTHVEHEQLYQRWEMLVATSAAPVSYSQSNGTEPDIVLIVVIQSRLTFALSVISGREALRFIVVELAVRRPFDASSGKTCFGVLDVGVHRECFRSFGNCCGFSLMEGR